MSAAPFSHGLERPPEALFHRLDIYRELFPPAERTQVRQAEEVEGVSSFVPARIALARAAHCNRERNRNGTSEGEQASPHLRVKL
jgi:hypothetical protein